MGCRESAAGARRSDQREMGQNNLKSPLCSAIKEWRMVKGKESIAEHSRSRHGPCASKRAVGCLALDPFGPPCQIISHHVRI